MRTSKHGRQRIAERDKDVTSINEAKRIAKLAFTAGKTIDYYQKCPKFYSYLQRKRTQTNNCSIRVYRGNIYIWRGKLRTLVTAHQIPDRFYDELEMN